MGALGRGTGFGAWALWACSGSEPKADTGTVEADADTDADADADADTDTDTDTDADVDPLTTTSVRIVHASAGLVDQDMVVNGILPVLENLGWKTSTPYSARPPNTYLFQFKDAGLPLDQAWISFDFELVTDRRHTFVVYGPPDAPDALRFIDGDLSIDPAQVRIRWTHVGVGLPSVVDLLETTNGTLLAADLAYGTSVELDYDPLLMSVGLDYDDDGTADAVFEPFERPAGEYFHIMIATDTLGTPFLLGQTPLGQTPTRALVPQ